MEVNDVLQGFATVLAELIARNSIKTVDEKIQTLKQSKDKEKIHAGYQAIINELLSEKEEAIRIAQGYKAELDRVEISEDDIQHLHNTITSVIEILLKFGLMDNDETDTGTLAVVEQLKELVSVDTLKTMQLLGFNYKAAIGEPLTELVANKISSLSKSSKEKPNTNKNRR